MCLVLLVLNCSVCVVGAENVLWMSCKEGHVGFGCFLLLHFNGYWSIHSIGSRSNIIILILINGKIKEKDCLAWRIWQFISFSPLITQPFAERE